MSRPIPATPYVRLLVTLVDDRQPGYVRHANTVARLAHVVGTQLGMGDAELERLRLAALLHDVGLLRLPFPHLGSRWDLPSEERLIWETHPEQGGRMVRMLGLPADTALAVTGHHERWDGSGYPRGSSGARIPLSARILGVCDVFDGACGGSLTFGDVRLSEAEALDLLEREESSRFDQRVVSTLREVLEYEREIGVLTGAYV